MLKIKKIKQRIVDRGWARTIQNLKRLDNIYAKVGLPEEGVVHPGNRRDANAPPAIVDMSDLVLIGIWNEFGVESRNQPARPWVRGAYNANFKDLKVVRDKLYLQVIMGKITAEMAIARMGEWMVNRTKKFVKELKVPENAPATIYIKTKGGRLGHVVNPLIHFGQMINSIQSVVIRKVI